MSKAHKTTGRGRQAQNVVWTSHYACKCFCAPQNENTGFYEGKAARRVAVACISGVQRHKAQVLQDHPIPKGIKNCWKLCLNPELRGAGRCTWHCQAANGLCKVGATLVMVPKPFLLTLRYSLDLLFCFLGEALSN